MRVDVVELPSQLTDALLMGRSAVVFDVLRATTSITTAIAHGAKRVRVFAGHEAMLAATDTLEVRALLAGETRCVRPAGFDLGNSPSEHASPAVGGREIFLSTTNGTRAIHASLRAKQIFVGALVNSRAVARELLATGDDVVLVCAGTQGEVADEDRAGAGAVASRLRQLNPAIHASAEVRACESLFRDAEPDIGNFLRKTTGGRNVIDAGLPQDIVDCGAIDRYDVVPRVSVIDDAVFIGR